MGLLSANSFQRSSEEEDVLAFDGGDLGERRKAHIVEMFLETEFILDDLGKVRIRKEEDITRSSLNHTS